MLTVDPSATRRGDSRQVAPSSLDGISNLLDATFRSRSIRSSSSHETGGTHGAWSAVDVSGWNAMFAEFGEHGGVVDA
jgi:hypothetical protein